MTRGGATQTFRLGLRVELVNLSTSMSESVFTLECNRRSERMPGQAETWTIGTPCNAPHFVAP